jgi:hypothetical protein
MLKLRCILLAVLVATSTQGYAENQIRMMAPIAGSSQVSKWVSAISLYTGWVDSPSPPECSNWAPEPITVRQGTQFLQTATDCKKTQQQSIQMREQNTKTLAYRNVGSPKLEYKVLTVSSTRNATGTQDPNSLGGWIATSPVVSEWENVGDVTGCTNWAPDPSTMPNGVEFEQQANDCKQTQQQTVQLREQNSTTQEYRSVGQPQIKTQDIQTNRVRTAMGTEDGIWQQADTYITVWTDTGEPTQCSAWTPDPSLKAEGYEFEQRSDCQQMQQRTLQPREINSVTGAYKNMGDPIYQNQFRDLSLTRKALGTHHYEVATMMVSVGRYAGQVGLLESVGMGSVVSSTNPAYVLNYLTLGANNKVYVSLQNSYDAQMITAITLEILDESDNVIGTLVSGDVIPLEAPFVGIEATPEATALAYASASKFRVTLSFYGH